MTDITLYYSSRCNMCKRFIQILYDMELLGMIKTKVSKEQNMFPDNIKYVPSIVTGDKLLQGEEVFDIIEFLQFTKNQQGKSEAGVLEEIQTLCDDDDEFCDFDDMTKNDGNKLQKMAQTFDSKSVTERLAEYQQMRDN